MRIWRWRRRRCHGGPSDESIQALALAERSLKDAEALALRAERASAVAREIKRVNHVAAAIDRSIRGA